MTKGEDFDNIKVVSKVWKTMKQKIKVQIDKAEYESKRRDRERLLKIHEKAKEIINITSQIKVAEPADPGKKKK